ncbi:MAG TPA: hypothetical protein DCQ28_04370 [Bacteroidetes bacterium]|nr:hypothetical protein [Bacteroidota bacterium]
MVVGGSPAMMSSGPSTVSEKIYLIDSTQNEEIELNREMLVSILSRYPDLQQAYTEASKSDQRNKLAQKLLGSCDPIMTRYFFRYIRRLKIEQRYIEQ